jgi:cobalamin biosynthetic protein CobC
VTEATFETALSRLSYHGGDLSAARRLFADAPQPWIDLSTGVNPHPYPLPDLPPDVWARLPEPDDLAALEAIAAYRYGASAAQTIAAPGSQAIIQWLARLHPNARVGALGFSYGGHADAWRGAGANLETVEAIGDLAAFDVAIVVNPNNPDGRFTDRDSMLALHGALAAHSGILIVDEAFMDFDTRGQSLVAALPHRNVVVLRSFGKSYGLAGLRLGFAIASDDLGARLRTSLGAWPVSGPAIAVGRRARADYTWLEQARQRAADEAERLDRLLSGHGFEIVGGAALFRLARHRHARAILDGLLSRGILVRPFAAFADLLRVGLPGEPEHWRRLDAALRTL